MLPEVYVPLYPDSDGNIVLKQKVPVSQAGGVEDGVGVKVEESDGVTVVVGVIVGVGVGLGVIVQLSQLKKSG